MTAVFALSEFDPACVCLSHAKALRTSVAPSRSVTYKLAAHVAYTQAQRDADWWRAALKRAGAERTEYDEREVDMAMLAYADSADIVQIAPGIGQPWASDEGDLRPRMGTADDPPMAPYFGVANWPELLMRKPRVAFFHGSKNAWANRVAYADYYREKGYALAASTLDYAVAMDAAWLPPCVGALDAGASAPLRGDDDPLIVAHTPTDPSNCHTEEFMQIARSLGVIVRYVTPTAACSSPSEALRAKSSAHAVFDHLRGSFSSNTVEGMARGCVPLVGVSTPCAERLRREGVSAFAPYVRDAGTLRSALITLRDDPSLTRVLQVQARQWVQTYLGTEAISARLTRFYEGLVRTP